MWWRRVVADLAVVKQKTVLEGILGSNWGSHVLLPHGFDTLLHPPHTSALFHRHASFVLDEDIFQGRELINRRSLQALVAGLKAYSTWETVSCLQDCRECTGGMVSS